MNTNSEAANTEAKETTDKVRVFKWWALKYEGGMLAVQLQDDRKGFLHVILDRAFDGSEDWCELEVIGESACSRYRATQVELPLGLRRHIACQAVTSVAGNLVGELHEEMMMDVPQYETYLEASSISEGIINDSGLRQFSTLIAYPDAVGCTEEEEIQNMQRLVMECRKYLPSGSNAAIPQETYGVGIE